MLPSVRPPDAALGCGPDGVDELGSLANQEIAGPEHEGGRLLLLALHGHEKRMVGRCAASQIASAYMASFFCRFTNGLT